MTMALLYCCVRAVPSRVNTDEFQFETTLIMDAVTVSDTLQPAIFGASLKNLLKKKLVCLIRYLLWRDTITATPV